MQLSKTFTALAKGKSKVILNTDFMLLGIAPCDPSE